MLLEGAGRDAGEAPEAWEAPEAREAEAGGALSTDGPPRVELGEGLGAESAAWAVVAGGAVFGESN